MNLEDHFSRENIINNLAKYEMYYQVALGSLINDTDSKQMDYNIELQLALGSVYELIKDLENDTDENIIFDNELSKQSAMDAVQNFVNENLELIKEGTFNLEPIINQINDGIFFNEEMKKVCKDNLNSQLKKWESIITQELADAIAQSLKDLENN